MTLTWKDAVTTLLAFAIIVFSYLTLKGTPVPFVSGFRMATLVLLVLGIGMCAMSSAKGQPSPFLTFLGGLGILSFILIAAGLITGAKIVFIGAVISIVILWILATARHAFGA